MTTPDRDVKQLNNSFICWFIYIWFCYFLVLFFIPQKMPTNACIVYFSKKIWKVLYRILKLKIGNQLNIATQVVRLIGWWPEWLFLGIPIHSFFFSGSPAELTRFHSPLLWFFCLFVFILFRWWLYKRKSFIVFCLKCQLMILYHKSL